MDYIIIFLASAYLSAFVIKAREYWDLSYYNDDGSPKDFTK